MINFKKSDINKLEVIGELIDLRLEQKLSRAGKQMIIGSVDVEVKKGETINVIELKVLSMYGNKSYKAIETVMNEYKTRKMDGVGEKVKIQGNVELNEYIGNDGMAKSFNVCNARFFHRLSEAEYESTGDRATLTIAGVYMDNEEIIDNEGLPTGEHEIVVYSKTYNGTTKVNDKINCLKGLKMSSDLFEVFEGQFSTGDEIVLNIEVNRGVVVKEVEEVKGFGLQPVVENNSYRWSFDIIGGNYRRSVEVEDIEELKRMRRVQLAEITGEGMANEGKSFGSKPTVDTNSPFDDDMPF